MIRLRYCSIEKHHCGCTVRFMDGTSVDATPHHTPHYYVISHRLGYGDNVEAYCAFHEFAHCFVEEKLHNRPSQVLWALAHGERLSGPDSVYEEIVAQAFQRWLHSNEEPVVSGVSWYKLKSEALEILDVAGWNPIWAMDGYGPSSK